MLINLSEVFTLEGKEKTWEVPFEAKAYKGSRVEYPVVSADPVKITVKNLGNRKLSLTGNTSVTLAIPCSRCLEPVNYTTEIEFDQLIVYSLRLISWLFADNLQISCDFLGGFEEYV